MSHGAMTMPIIAVHRRQFVVGPAPWSGAAALGWETRAFGPRLWVSHCPELRAGWAHDAEGGPWVLLGLAAQTLPSEPDPLAVIAASTGAAVAERYASWAGRWILLGRDQVHLDASGLLGCFYGTAPDGRVWASSSPVLLAELLSPVHPLAADPRALRYGKGIAWYPPPRTRFTGMQRLLPSQLLRLTDAAVSARPLVPALDRRADDATLEVLFESFVVGLRRVARVADVPLWISLSAGGDSRLVLAAALEAGVELRAFTRVARRMSVADHLLPPKLAAVADVPHRFLTSGRRMPARRALVADHTAGHVSDGDAEPFLCGVRDALDGITVGGQGFGVGKLLLRGLPAELTDVDRAAGDLAAAFGEEGPSTATAALRDWLAWVVATPHAQLDWRDRFYLEQRMAGWQAAKEQLYDMNQHERFFPLNASRSHALLLSVAAGRRTGLRHHEDLLRQHAPALLQYPINPSDGSFGVVRSVWIRSRHDPLHVVRRLFAYARGRAS